MFGNSLGSVPPGVKQSRLSVQWRGCDCRMSGVHQPWHIMLQSRQNSWLTASEMIRNHPSLPRPPKPVSEAWDLHSRRETRVGHLPLLRTTHYAEVTFVVTLQCKHTLYRMRFFSRSLMCLKVIKDACRNTHGEQIRRTYLLSCIVHCISSYLTIWYWNRVGSFIVSLLLVSIETFLFSDLSYSSGADCQRITTLPIFSQCHSRVTRFLFSSIPIPNVHIQFFT